MNEKEKRESTIQRIKECAIEITRISRNIKNGLYNEMR